MSTIKNMNLIVSDFAMKCVNEVIRPVEESNSENSSSKEKKSEKLDKAKYSTLVKKMATMIQKNGYIATLAFCLSKGKPEHKKVLSNIIAWNYKNEKIRDIVFDSEFINAMDEKIKEDLKGKSEEEKCEIYSRNYTVYISRITKLPQNNYRLITKEMMTLFGWIKRFADGMIEVNNDEQNADT